MTSGSFPIRISISTRSIKEDLLCYKATDVLYLSPCRIKNKALKSAKPKKSAQAATDA
jgi:hypothetical protein